MTELIRTLKALSDETRLNLVKLLLKHNYCVGALSKQLNISKSAVSQHLKILRVAGIVKGEKRGYYTHYFVNRELLKDTASKIVELSNLAPADKGCTKNMSDGKTCCSKEDLI